jgi:hypothetical protein
VKSLYRRGTHPANRKKPGQLSRTNRRNTTGCVGISVKTCTRTGRLRRYFVVCAGRNRRPGFCIETLGRETAWRKAMAARAAYERDVALSKTTNPKTAPCHSN